VAGRITRKELKSDKFALEVGQTVDFVTEHRRELTLYGSIAAVVALVAVGIYFYMGHEHTVRENALGDAIQMQEAPVAPAASAPRLSFPTEDAKRAAVTKAFGEIAASYPGSSEGAVAKYYLGAIAADQGKLPDAEKLFQEAANAGDKNYGPLARFSLAQVYFAEGRTTDAEKILRDLIQHPAIFVSKEQATIALAKGIAATKPDEARKLLDPLRTETGAVSQAAVAALSELTVPK
jgi:predicted negative regulator of RcsB-dependent stress response